MNREGSIDFGKDFFSPLFFNAFFNRHVFSAPRKKRKITNSNIFYHFLIFSKISERNINNILIIGLI